MVVCSQVGPFREVRESGLWTEGCQSVGPGSDPLGKEMESVVVVPSIHRRRRGLFGLCSLVWSFRDFCIDENFGILSGLDVRSRFISLTDDFIF